MISGDAVTTPEQIPDFIQVVVLFLIDLFKVLINFTITI